MRVFDTGGLAPVDGEAGGSRTAAAYYGTLGQINLPGSQGAVSVEHELAIVEDVYLTRSESSFTICSCGHLQFIASYIWHGPARRLCHESVEAGSGKQYHGNTFRGITQ